MIAQLGNRAELKAVLRSIVELSKNLVQADTATLYIYDTATATYNMATDLGATKPLDRMPRESGPTAKIVGEKKLLFSNNALEHPLFGNSPYTRSENIRSVAGVPLERGGTIIGVLYFNYRTPDQITEERIRIIELFAQLAATAIDNTRLLEERDQIAQTLALLHKVGRSILSTQELSRIVESSEGVGISDIEQVRIHVLEQIAKAAVQALAIDIVTVYEYDQAINDFKLPPAMAGGLREPGIPRRTKIYPDDAAVILINKGFDSYFARDAQHDEIMCGPLQFDHEGRPKQRFVYRENIVSSGILRLKAGAETVGVMFVNFRAPQQFSDEQKAVISVFADQAALAIQNARIYKRIAEELIAEQKKRLTAKFDNVAGAFFHRVVNEIGTISVATGEIRYVITPSTPEYQEILWHLNQIDTDVTRFKTLADKVRFPFKRMSPSQVNINQCVSDTLEQMTIPPNVRVVKELANFPLIVSIDASMFVTILRNILDNALEAMPSGGVLTVCTRLAVDGTRTFIEIDVRDTGKGIPEHMQVNLFEPFTTRKEKGTGIGLWQCKTFLERIGGTVAVKSELTKGSIFTISLPLAS
jgi:signal transduction histidine kinase